MSKALTFDPKLTELLKKINAVITDKDARRRLLNRAILELKDLASAYPEAGKWNSAPGTNNDGRWYQRNFGTRYQRKNGTISGRNTSQRLKENWRIDLQGNSIASTYTEVTYAPYLLDPAQQVHWASPHGWQNLDEIEDEYAPRFEEIALEEIDKQIKKI